MSEQHAVFKSRQMRRFSNNDPTQETYLGQIIKNTLYRHALVRNTHEGMLETPGRILEILVRLQEICGCSLELFDGFVRTLGLNNTNVLVENLRACYGSMICAPIVMRHIWR